ncbi:pitrilysin family protein [Desulfurobacterium sp.]|uniref:M16 family metallopeptidase n=1 Tax=Desulfurobacterium sp. TaxID=2004706 RepID=UPI002605766C|nr:pitrilysin family protein [Desulfurobacterium sp.]
MIVERLENGINVVLKDRKDVSSVSVQFWLKTGALWENEKNRGIAHFLEHMVFNGTKNYPAGTIEKIVENNGGEINAATSYDYTYYYVTIPEKHVFTAVKLLKDIVFYPLLLPEMVEKEKPIVLEEIARSENDPRQVFWRNFYQKIFQEVNYRYPILGFRNTVSSFTAENVREFHRDHYHGGNLTVVISGNINEKELLHFLKEELSPLPSKNPDIPPSVDEPELIPRNEIMKHPAVANTHVLIGWKIPGLSQNVNTAVLSVLESYLSYGRSSVLYQEVIEKGTAYAAMGLKDLFLSSGLFYIYGITEPSKAGLFKEKIFEIIRSSVDETAFELAKKKVLKTEIFKKESVESEAEELGYSVTLFGNLDYYQKLIESIKKLTLEEFVKGTEFLKNKHLQMLLLPEGGNK